MVATPSVELIGDAELALARDLARRYVGRGVAQEDLEQVAYLALVLAATRFDPTRGASFGAFAAPTILGELRRHFRDHTWMIRPPRPLQELRPVVREAELALAQRLGRRPLAGEVAAELGIPVERVADVEQAARGYSAVHLDAPIGLPAEGPGTLADIVVDPDAPGEDEVLDRVAARTLLAALDERARRIVALRYWGDLTQQEIADRLGLSQVQISRILARSLELMRAAAAPASPVAS